MTKTKLNIFFLLFMALLICNACEEPISSNPKEDNTKLWPAADSTGERFGFINEQGEMVIPAQYHMAYYFSGGVAAVVTTDVDRAIQFIDKKGKVVYTLPQSYNCDPYICNGGRRFWYGIEYGMYDEHFNEIVCSYYDHKLGTMSKEGLIFFWRLAGEGFYNRKGEVVLYNPHDSITGMPKEYTYADDSFHEGREIVMARPGGYYGAINTRGELVIDTAYSHLHYAGNGLLAYQVPGGDYYYYGLMDIDGNILTEQIYKVVYYDADGDNGWIPVSDENNNVCYVDRTGKKVLQSSFIGYSYPFYEGVAWANILDLSESRMADVLLDTDGNILWKVEKDGRFLSVMHNGLCVIEEDSIVKYVNKSKECVYSWKRPKYSPFTLNPLYVPAKNEHN